MIENRLARGLRLKMTTDLIGIGGVPFETNGKYEFGSGGLNRWLI